MSTKFSRLFVFRILLVATLLSSIGLSAQPAAAAPQAISVNACAMVYNSNSAGGLAVRVNPTTSAAIIKRIGDGTIVKISEGPRSANGYTWWKHDQGGWSAGSYLRDTACPVVNPPMLDKLITLVNGRTVKARDLDGLTPAKGMDSTYGKPGQLPLTAPVTSNTASRSALLYRAVIHQFAVGNNARYTPSSGYTYCNTFAGDVMRAMGASLPTKREYSGGALRDDATIGFPALYNWLNGQSNGWRKVALSNWSQVVAHVNAGKPALAVTTSHVAVIRPNQSNVSGWGQLRIAQAGASGRITNDTNLYFQPAFFVIHD
jgi:hypothetical protein